MDSGEIFVSADTTIRVFLLLLYVPIGLISYRFLIPRLSTTSARLASVMLAAQVLVIVLSLESRSSSQFESWLWDFHEEWNIPATLAFVQLALVGSVALLASWHAMAQRAWHRLYLVGTGLVFLFLALDEYFALHEFIEDWEFRYIGLGAAVVLATLAVAARSTQRARVWHVCLLFGLAISVSGAMVFNALPIACDTLGPLSFDGCLEFYIQEETLELLGIWLTLVAMLGHFSSEAPTPRPRVRGLLYMLPALSVVLLLLYSLSPHLEARLLAQQAQIQFETGFTIQGYRIDNGGGTSRVRIYASAKQRDYLGLGFSIHLVDQVNGDSVAGLDEWADRQHGFWFFGPDYAPVFGQWMVVQIPSDAPTNRALRIVLTLWRKQRGEFMRQVILSSDHRLLDDTQVVLGELVLQAKSAESSMVPLAAFDNGFTLGAVDLPEYGRAGEIMTIPFTWRSEIAGGEDHIQFLHVGHAESGEWWIYDQHPLGRRLPTRLWFSGLNDSELGRCRCRRIWRPGDMISSPVCTVCAISSACQRPTPTECIGWIPGWRWEP